ncbi:MAG TPA: molybdenum cofactor biosynthesis protein MoaE [Gemmatimonadales bacterium]|nr:molybdenum cofactor biosynthesis protein MoaE [Gemmatimonadales bacterium]
MTYLTRAPLSLDALLAAVASPEVGGTCVFLGTVRNAPEDRGVTAIEYTAYEAMADAELGRILSETRDRWPGVRVAVAHRVGRIPVGEASVAIAAAAPHRGEAFAACRYVIEELKRRLPVWKEEFRLDGTSTWVGAPGSAELPKGAG